MTYFSSFSLSALLGLSLLFSPLASSLAQARESSGSSALGRLFFTPEHRLALDRQRQSDTEEKEEIPEESNVPSLTVDGVVVRSDGKQTVWINGQPHGEETRDGIHASATAKNPAQITVRSGDDPSIRAKVGDTIIRDTGETNDLLKGGTVTLKKNPDGE